MSVLQMAAKLHDKSLLHALLQKKADPNKHDPPIMEFKFLLTLAHIEPGGLYVVKLLVNAGANVNCGHQFSSQKAFRNGVTVDAHPHCSNYPLELAVQNGELDCAEELIKAGARVRDSWPLRSAIKRKDREMICVLLTAGADPNGWINGLGTDSQ
jgi:hypothetical protein